MKTAILVTIGDEILSGSTLDTNSNFIAQQLKSIGIKVVEIKTISDEETMIYNTFSQAIAIADIVKTASKCSTDESWSINSLFILDSVF